MLEFLSDDPKEHAKLPAAPREMAETHHWT